jgi:uncharacterized protein (UPF0333 family)
VQQNNKREGQMKKKNKKGQSTLEYIILITAVIAVAIVFLKPVAGGKLYDTVDNSYTAVANGINTLTNKLTNTW